jgi:hypothetical protein
MLLFVNIVATRLTHNIRTLQMLHGQSGTLCFFGGGGGGRGGVAAPTSDAKVND